MDAFLLPYFPAVRAGSLAISLWHGGSDYFIADRDELDEYIEQRNEMTMGVM